MEESCLEQKSRKQTGRERGESVAVMGILAPDALEAQALALSIPPFLGFREQLKSPLLLNTAELNMSSLMLFFEYGE